MFSRRGYVLGPAVVPGLRKGYSTSSVKREEDYGLDVLRDSPYDMVEVMQKLNLRRMYAVYDSENKCINVSHPIFEPIKKHFENDKVDFREHEGFFLEIGKRSGALMGAFIWKTNRGQACGGIRLWEYSSIEEYIRDGIRLGFGMGVKSALAGLWAGGGKGVIAKLPNRTQTPEERRDMFLDYGNFLSSLNGCYVAAEDVGLTVSDLDTVHSQTRYTTCISQNFGGSGNPSTKTAVGVVCAMEGAVDHLNPGDTLEGKTVAMQGLGNVGCHMSKILMLKKGVKKIIGHDVNEELVKKVTEELEGLKKQNNLETELHFECVVKTDMSIFEQECDVLCPNALGGVLNEQTIPLIKAKIVCGSANNQLRDPEDDMLLKQRGISYVVDFLCNRMGIVNCADEAFGRISSPDEDSSRDGLDDDVLMDPFIARHFGRDWDNSLFKMTKEILRRAEEEDTTPGQAAIKLALKLANEDHPVWPRRSQDIINHLVNTRWSEKI
eukprot:Nk52_evm51s2309 gene=Nk52_evmTU51s2309